ncbi:MAG: hypothetical protein AB1758_09015 [Candidatus Eremiobacterota bacterium]
MTAMIGGWLGRALCFLESVYKVATSEDYCLGFEEPRTVRVWRRTAEVEVVREEPGEALQLWRPELGGAPPLCLGTFEPELYRDSAKAASVVLARAGVPLEASVQEIRIVSYGYDN